MSLSRPPFSGLFGSISSPSSARETPLVFFEKFLHFQTQFSPILAKFRLLRPKVWQTFVPKMLVSSQNSLLDTLLLKIQMAHTYQNNESTPSPQSCLPLCMESLWLEGVRTGGTRILVLYMHNQKSLKKGSFMRLNVDSRLGVKTYLFSRKRAFLNSARGI